MASPGGGGTFVALGGLQQPLLVAGGGGGTRGETGDRDGGDAELGEDGGAGRGNSKSLGGKAGQGGCCASGSYGNGGPVCPPPHTTRDRRRE